MQDPAERKFLSKEFSVGEDERDVVQRSGEKKTIFTELVLVVSNFHFNKKAQTLHQDVTCSPLDCYVSLKYSSSKFKPTATDVLKTDDDVESTSVAESDGANDVSGNSASRYFFDSHYVFLSYQGFTSLVVDPYLATSFWPKVKANFEKTTGLPLEVTDLLEIFFEDDDDDDAAAATGPSAAAVEEKRDESKKLAGKTRATKKRAAQRLESSDDDEDNDEDNDEEDDDDGNDSGPTEKHVKKPPAKSAKKKSAQKKSKQ